MAQYRADCRPLRQGRQGGAEPSKCSREGELSARSRVRRNLGWGAFATVEIEEAAVLGLTKKVDERVGLLGLPLEQPDRGGIAGRVAEGGRPNIDLPFAFLQHPGVTRGPPQHIPNLRGVGTCQRGYEDEPYTVRVYILARKSDKEVLFHLGDWSQHVARSHAEAFSRQAQPALLRETVEGVGHGHQPGKR